MAKSNPLASNLDITGAKLFVGFHGITQTIPANSTNDIDFIVNYEEVKFDSLEVFDCNKGDIAVLKVINGTPSVVPGVPDGVALNQFGYAVNMKSGHNEFVGPYPSSLKQGMIVRIEYTNNSSDPLDLCINYRYHELVYPS